jgi:hypothetical protein
MFGFVLASLGSPVVFSQELDPPKYEIVSDYGPRIIPKGNGSPIHLGVDYGAPLAAGIVPVESGTISGIGYHGGWFVDIKGLTGKFTYLHLFSGKGAKPSPSGGFELFKKANLTDEDNLSKQGNVIVQWGAKGAEKALSQFDKCTVFIGNKILKGPNGKPILTRSVVETSEAIGPVGTSGGFPAHLHIGYENKDNPLYILKHPPDGAPKVIFETPAEKLIDEANWLSPFPIKFSVDSTAGLDLDKVDIFFYRYGDPSQPVHLGPAGKPTFGYGGRPKDAKTGRPDETKTATVVKTNGSTTGVQPLDADGKRPDNQPGLDRFIFRIDSWAIDNGKSLPTGEGHALAVKCKDVNGNEVVFTTAPFVIDVRNPREVIEPGDCISTVRGDCFGKIYPGNACNPYNPVTGSDICDKILVRVNRSTDSLQGILLRNLTTGAIIQPDRPFFWAVRWPGPDARFGFGRDSQGHARLAAIFYNSIDNQGGLP